MNIAEIIRNGIPKVGEAYMSDKKVVVKANIMSDNILYDCSLPTAQKYQVIGYGDYYGDLTIHVVMDNFKTLKIEKYPLSNFLSMKLKRTAPFINEMSIKKTTLMENNKFYLNPYGILYTHSDRCSLLVNGIAITVIRKRIETIKDDNRIYEVTDMNCMFNSCFKLNRIKMIGCSKDTIENIRTYLADEDITGVTIIQ